MAFNEAAIFHTQLRFHQQQPRFLISFFLDNFLSFFFLSSNKILLLFFFSYPFFWFLFCFLPPPVYLFIFFDFAFFSFIHFILFKNFFRLIEILVEFTKSLLHFFILTLQKSFFLFDDFFLFSCHFSFGHFSDFYRVVRKSYPSNPNFQTVGAQINHLKYQKILYRCDKTFRPHCTNS